MTEQEVITLMESSRTSDEWNANCNKVKDAHGGRYPEYWYKTIVVERAKSIMSRFGASPELQIECIG